MNEELSKKDRDLLKMAIKAFENQSDKVCVERDEVGYCWCPACNRTVKIGDSYCSGCGKELDWKYAFDTISLNKKIKFGGISYEIEDISWEERWTMPDELTITAKEILPEEDEE